MSVPTENFVPKPIDVNNLDIFAKLEKRLNPPNALKEDLGSPNRYMHTIIKADTESSTLEDSNSNQAVNANQFRATTPNSSRSKSQFEPPTDRENSQEAMERLSASESNHKRSVEIEQGESYEEPPGKSPKLKEDNDGSRGANSKKGTISSYFSSTNKNVINLVDGGSAPSSLFEATTKTGATLANSGSSDALNKMKNSNGTGSKASVKDNGAVPAAIQLQQQALQTANEALKKELEAMKLAKDQAENKVGHC